MAVSEQDDHTTRWVFKPGRLAQVTSEVGSEDSWRGDGQFENVLTSAVVGKCNLNDFEFE